jgi:hypothetical protein
MTARKLPIAIAVLGQFLTQSVQAMQPTLQTFLTARPLSCEEQWNGDNLAAHIP